MGGWKTSMLLLLFRILSSFRPTHPRLSARLLVKGSSEIGFLGGSCASQIECQNFQID